jgi:hypothetical protein
MQDLENVVKKKVSDYNRYPENPFLTDIVKEVEPVQRMKWSRAANKEVLHTVFNSSTGEVIGHSAFMQMVEVDEKQFAKLYLSNMAAFWDLSKPAIRVFTYIMTVIKPNQDKFYFVAEDCMEYTDYKTRKPILEGLADLLANSIIARGKHHSQYYINPMIIFNGNRITFAKTYVRKQIKKIAADHQLELFADVDKLSYGRLQDEVLKLEGRIREKKE